MVYSLTFPNGPPSRLVSLNEDTPSGVLDDTALKNVGPIDTPLSRKPRLLERSPVSSSLQNSEAIFSAQASSCLDGGVV